MSPNHERKTRRLRVTALLIFTLKQCPGPPGIGKRLAVVQSLSHVQLFATPWTAACQAPLSSTISQSLLKLMSIEMMMSFNHFALYHPLLLMSSIFPGLRAFSNELALCIRCPKYLRFSISHFNGYSGLISFRID